MFGAVHSLLCVGGIDIGIVEEAETELGGENVGNGSVEVTLGDGALLDQIEQSSIDRAVGQVVIDARGNCEARSISVVERYVMGSDKHLETIAIGGDVAFESPLLAQDFIEQPVVDVR